MTGEMCKEEVTREAYPAHFAMADGLNSEVKPFDQYQGPFVQVPGARLWLSSEDGAEGYVYNENNDKKSEPFWLHYKDPDTLPLVAVAAAREVYSE